MTATRKEQLFDELRDIEGQLSPENLYQDGERPAYMARQIATRLMVKKNKITTELGFTPTLQELFQFPDVA